jgi:hypothetical protein
MARARASSRVSSTGRPSRMTMPAMPHMPCQARLLQECERPAEGLRKKMVKL